MTESPVPIAESEEAASSAAESMPVEPAAGVAVEEPSDPATAAAVVPVAPPAPEPVVEHDPVEVPPPAVVGLVEAASALTPLVPGVPTLTLTHDAVTGEVTISHTNAAAHHTSWLTEAHSEVNHILGVVERFLRRVL